MSSGSGSREERIHNSSAVVTAPALDRAARPAANRASLDCNETDAGRMKAARSFHVAILLADGRVLVTGGSPVGMHAAASHNLTSAEVYDPKTGKFSPTGSMTTERASHTATRLAGGRVLITGGALSTASDAGSLSQASAELYDPKTGTFRPTGSMSFARTFHEATLLADDRVLVTGGSADGWGYVATTTPRPRSTIRRPARSPPPGRWPTRSSPTRQPCSLAAGS